ncbi:MAG: transcriptional regulator [Gammaproteobacteria bacterium]|nr:transcriptional regulator [Gammaproteobacteria bacterium]
MIVIEAPSFSRHVYDYLSDDDYAALQWSLTLHPEAGAIVPGSGGLRKLRWATAGKGKRGGLRIIYYWKNRQGEIWLLAIYAKNEMTSLPQRILRALKQELES